MASNQGITKEICDYIRDFKQPAQQTNFFVSYLPLYIQTGTLDNDPIDNY